MLQSPIVAFDGSEPALRALKAGLDLCSRLNLPLRVISVVEETGPVMTPEAYGVPDPTLFQDLARHQDEFRVAMLSTANQMGHEAGVEIIAECVDGDEVGEIVEAVIRHHCDLLIVGLRHHPGLMDRLLCHTAQNLTARAPCSVLSVR